MQRRMMEFDYEEVVKATDNFNPTRLIGKGSHGLVYKGVLSKHNNTFVAIKKPSSQSLHQSLHHDNINKLQNEIQVLSSLSDNPHVLKLLGTSYDDSFNNNNNNNNKLIVIEFMPNGSLHDRLHDTTAQHQLPTWPKRVEITMQIVRAVQFLHEGKPLVIHRDIKSSNILFDSHWNVKLADFGLAVMGGGMEAPNQQPAGTLGYLDPCYTTPYKLSTKNDMFSFGVVLLEIISGRKAIDLCNTPSSIVEWAIPLIEQQQHLEQICDTRIMAVPNYLVSTITHFLRVAARCVSPNEDERPSAREVIVGMENCFIERVRFPIWASILKSMMRLRKRKKVIKSIISKSKTQVACECKVQEHRGEGDNDNDNDMLTRKQYYSLTIKQVLADHVAFNLGKVPQDVVATGGKCMLLRWVTEDTLKALKEKEKEPSAPEPEPEPTTEVLFLCSYEGCGKTFIDASALRKHSNIHGERQFVCHYEGCGKVEVYEWDIGSSVKNTLFLLQKFLDSSKLKRHFLIHTGERDFVCPHEGCGKAFSLDFNLRSHMKTHSQENYHLCPYPDCGKRYAHEYKLRNHIASHHEKSPSVDVAKYTPPSEKQTKTPKPSSATYGSASSDRPYACPYEGCEKAYIHEYKLRLHLKREHPGHDENAVHLVANADNVMDEASDQDAVYGGGKPSNGKSQKQSRPKPNLKLPPSKISQRKGSAATPVATLNVIKKPWPMKGEAFDEDSEETEEEDRDNVEDGWRYGGNHEDDDEETEYED
ncbi:hypothetical protein RIF29_41759 [Crotalaria pallida]|uniref:non-specific serine/threonine protein kinase n=1 Tax=Crotalaria pallida TaxID=3830 RepID=A0AAN9E5P9_CROPI